MLANLGLLREEHLKKWLKPRVSARVPAYVNLLAAATVSHELSFQAVMPADMQTPIQLFSFASESSEFICPSVCQRF